MLLLTLSNLEPASQSYYIGLLFHIHLYINTSYVNFINPIPLETIPYFLVFTSASIYPQITKYEVLTGNLASVGSRAGVTTEKDYVAARGGKG